MADYVKPLPTIDPDTKPFWEGCKRHELRLPKCRDCGLVYLPPRAVCPHCLTDRVDWIKASGKGNVYSFSVVHQNKSPGFREDGPYVVAYVTLQEGPQMFSNVIGIDPYRVKIDMPVQVVFEDATETIAIPKFKPA